MDSSWKIPLQIQNFSQVSISIIWSYQIYQLVENI